MPTVVLLGSLDTKGVEYGFLRDRLIQHGMTTILVDTGVIGNASTVADIGPADVAARAGTDLETLRDRHDRGDALAAMTAGATAILGSLYAEGRLDGAMALGGTGGTAVASAAFRELPLGVPKVIVSTAASGATAPYVAESDLILVPSVTDVAGLNRLLRTVIANAAAAMAGMVSRGPIPAGAAQRVIGASMFGVTTPCVTEARRLLDDLAFETLVFHMTGTGGRTLEQLIRQGWVDGVLDVTTTELADELVGGVFSAGPGRLTGAASMGVPQVVSVGALDMVNFGPVDTVPPQFAGRRFHRHNASVTLMRTTPDECAELGRRLADRVSASTGRAAVFLPLRGVSVIATTDGPFYDPNADGALFDAIRGGLDRSRVELVEIDTDINDPAFASAMVSTLLEYLG
jgi:uncharacterized protein (UPF0261 family)